jgi:hypothetical protein
MLSGIDKKQLICQLKTNLLHFWSVLYSRAAMDFVFRQNQKSIFGKNSNFFPDNGNIIERFI